MFFEWILYVVSEDTSQGAAAFVRKGDLKNYKLPKLVVVMQYVTEHICTSSSAYNIFLIMQIYKLKPYKIMSVPNNMHFLAFPSQWMLKIALVVLHQKSHIMFSTIWLSSAGISVRV